MGIAESIIHNELIKELYSRRKADIDRSELLASPDKLAKQVDEVTAQFYPYIKKPPKMSKYVHKFQAYDETARKKGSAMAGFGAEVHDLYARTLALPENSGYKPEEILGGVVQHVMTKRKSPEHTPRIASLYQEKMMADTDITNLFGLFGEDASVRKPPGEMLGLPGYDEYKKSFMTQDPAYQETGVVESAAIGAGFEALLVGAKAALGKQAVKGLAVAAATSLGVPPAAVAIGGAALLAIPAFKVYDSVSNTISKSEWGRAREGTYRKIGADLLLGGLVPIVGAQGVVKGSLKRLAKAGVLEGTAFENLVRKPTAKAVIDAKAAQNEVAKATDGFNRALAKADKRKLKGGVWDAIRSIESPDTVTAPEALPFKKAFQKLDEIDLDHVFRLKDRGRTLEEATIDVAQNKAVKKSVTKAEKARAAKISKAKKTEAVDPAFGTAEIEDLEKAKKAGYTEPKRVTLGGKDLIKQGDKYFDATGKEYFKKIKKEVDTAALLKEVAAETKGTYSWRARQAALREEGEIGAIVKTEEEYAASLRKKLEDAGGIKGSKPATELLTEELTDADIKVVAEEYKGLTEQHGKIWDDLIDDPIEDIMDKGVRDHSFSDKMFYGIAALGTAMTAAMFELFSPQEAEAGVVADVGKAIWKAGKPLTQGLKKSWDKAAEDAGSVRAARQAYKDFFEGALREEGVIGVPPTEANPYIFQAGKHMSLAELVTKDLGKMTSTITRTKTLPLGAGRYVSPHTIGQLFFKTGYSPELELAHMMSTYHFNTASAMQAITNVFREVPEIINQKATAEIMDFMKPLADRHGPTVTVMSSIEAKLIKKREQLEKLIAGKPKKMGTKKYTQVLERLGTDIGDLEVAAEELKPAYDAFVGEWEIAAKELADKYSTSRVFLAAEDTAEYDFYPWLKGKLSPDEEAAVARIKDINNNYAGRMKELKIDTIEHRPYMHHAFHPSWNEKGASDLMKSLDISVSDAFPYTKFFRRTMYSKAMMPDAVYSMQRYITDAERRLGWTRFWGKGKKDSWWALSRSNTVRGSTELSEFFQRIKDSSVPYPLTTGNKLANTYSALEVMRLLAFSPSVAFKHLFKQIGTYSTLGVKTGVSHQFESALMASRVWWNSPEVKTLTSKLGVKGAKKKVLDDVAEAYLHQGRLLNNIADMEIGYTLSPGYVGKFDSFLGRINKPGSVPIRAIEAFDRAVSFNTAIEMAAKRGMTAQQATFGIYSTVLKNNFLSGPLNPAWMLNPKIRALFLFQNTAFKIMERRLVTAVKTGKAVKLAWKEGSALIKKEGVGEALRQLTDVRRFVKGAEAEFKANVIADALGSQRDYFGNSIVRQFMRESLLVGAVISGSGHLGVDLMPHTFHVPFLVQSKTDPTLATSPAAKAVIRTYNDWAEETEEDRDFIVSAFLKNWFGSTRGLPLMVNKGLRINEGDIPAIYEEGKFPSWLKYLFSVPGKERD